MSENVTIVSVPAFSTLCNLAFSLRLEVFVHEQGVPLSEEIDLHDSTARHFVALADGEVVGTLRLVTAPEHVKIGRVAVKATARGKGIAKQLMLHAMADARSKGHDRFYLAAQTDKTAFYSKLGFTASGDEFMDGGMPHLAMRNY